MELGVQVEWRRNNRTGWRLVSVLIDWTILCVGIFLMWNLHSTTLTFHYRNLVAEIDIVSKEPIDGLTNQIRIIVSLQHVEDELARDRKYKLSLAEIREFGVSEERIVLFLCDVLPNDFSTLFPQFFM